MDFASDCKRCEECSEVTKRPVGLWDGVDEHGNAVSGCFFDCDNTECAIHQERIRKIAEEKSKMDSVAKQNEAAGTSAAILRKLRRRANCTLRTAAEVSGMAIGEYSAMECGRKVIPMELFQFLRYVFINMIMLKEDVNMQI